MLPLSCPRFLIQTASLLLLAGSALAQVEPAAQSAVDTNRRAEQYVEIGYGPQRLGETAAVGTLAAASFNRGLIATPEQLLGGRLAGVQVRSAGGEPGGAQQLIIRGLTSIRFDSQPLVVIDGIPLIDEGAGNTLTNYGTGSHLAPNPLTFLNPDDIENISVLKDASSAAIYGGRGSNGVVLITTRRGRTGPGRLNVSVAATLSTLPHRYNLLDASGFLQALSANGIPVTPEYNRGANTDWQDQIFRAGVSQTYHIGYGGGTGNTRYSVSFGYSDQQGISKQSGLHRLTGRINAEQDLLNDRFTLGLQLTTTGVSDEHVPTGYDADFRGNLIGAALMANPTYPVYDDQGRFFNPNGYNAQGVPNGNVFRNPVSLLKGIDDVSNTTRTVGNVSATWRIVKGLAYKSSVGLDNARSERHTSILRNLSGVGEVIPQNGGLAAIQTGRQENWLLEHILTYDRPIGSSTLSVLTGYATQSFSRAYETFTATGIQTNIPFPYANNIQPGNPAQYRGFDSGSTTSEGKYRSYFGRVQYALKRRYWLSAVIRTDQATGLVSRAGTFPAMSAGWRLSDESFWRAGRAALTLRVGWGQTGFQGSPLMQPVASGGPSMSSLNWERTAQVNIGVDLSVAAGRLRATLDYFDKTTSGLLLPITAAAPGPVAVYWTNVDGQVLNRGIEVSVQVAAVQKTRFGWLLSANATYLTNRVTGLDRLQSMGAVYGQGLSGAYTQRIQEGQSLHAFQMPTFTGYDTQGFGQYSNPSLTPAYIGSALPTYFAGLTNVLRAGNWQLTALLTAAGGHRVYNNTANASFVKGSLGVGRNVTQEVVNNGENRINAPIVSTRFLERGNFVRLSNVVLSRSFALSGQSANRQIQLSLAAQNVWLLAAYTGLDPEIGLTREGRTGFRAVGIDYQTYPLPRSITIGAQLIL